VSDVVLDASAVIALLKGERGAEVVRAALPEAIVSAVNYAEVGSYLASVGLGRAEILAVLGGTRLAVVPFDEAQALEVVRLRPLTRSLGLSLGDRACLALAGLRRLTALTADEGWADLDLGIDVRVIRGAGPANSIP
jgi:PIN domain nuclease of toxin-antitoxin system